MYEGFNIILINKYLYVVVVEFVVVHNGIITNYNDIKKFLVRITLIAQ